MAYQDSQPRMAAQFAQRSSWYVDPLFRIHAARLSSIAQKNKDVTYINISPAATTWPIIEAQGFKLYCSGLFFSVPILSRTETGATIETVTPETRSIKDPPEEDFELLASHAQYGYLAFVCHTTDGPLPFVMTPKWIRTGRMPLPAMQLVYCRNTADYVRCAGAIGRFLVRHGKPVVILDANGPVPGLAGIYTEKRGRKYFKGPTPQVLPILPRPNSYCTDRDHRQPLGTSMAALNPGRLARRLCGSLSVRERHCQ